MLASHARLLHFWAAMNFPVNQPRSDEYEELYADMVRESEGLQEEIFQREGGMLPLEDFAQRLDVPPRRVLADVSAGRIIGLPGEKEASMLLPAWQLYRNQLLSGIAEVAAVLRENDASPLECVIFFVYENAELEATPLELLRRGEIKTVIDAATREGQMGC